MSPKVAFFICLAFLGVNVSLGYTNDQIDLISNINKTLGFDINFLQLSEPCYNSYMELLSQIVPILQLFDVSAKFMPTGITQGNMYDYGSFDGCYGLKMGSEDKPYYGKYCLGGKMMDFNYGLRTINQTTFANFGPTPVTRTGTPLASLGFSMGYCTPHTCSAEDMGKLMSALTLSTVTFHEELCYSKDTEPELSSGAIATIVVLSIFGLIVVLSTAYDIKNYYQEKKPRHELFIAFSFLTNGRKLFKSSKDPDQLLCLHGIRALSMAWVIVGHEYAFFAGSPVSNMIEASKFMSDKGNMWMISAQLSVDSFFMVGGLVTMYSFLKSMDKGIKFNILLYYIHRYLRLTPAIAIMTLIHLYLLEYIGNGPMHYTVGLAFKEPCEENWWAGLLYVQNYRGDSSGCIPQTWYLSVDMQLFVLSPIILYPIMKKPRIGFGLLILSCIAGVVVPFVICYHYDIIAISANGATVEQSTEFMKYYYGATYSRFGPYVFGLLFGWYVYKNRNNKWQKPWTSANVLWVSCVWIIVTGLVMTCVYSGASLMGEPHDTVKNSLYNALNRNAWAVSLGFVIVLCTSGMGGPINSFLSMPVFQFLAKVSYSMYLVHYPVEGIKWYNAKYTTQFSNYFLMQEFWGDFMFTLGLSILFCLMFESPIIILEKYIFKRK